MYAVVGCDRCDALWVVADRPETTSCPRCEKRHRFATLKQFATTEDETAAREARAAMLAHRQGAGDAYEDLDSMAAMEAALDEAGVDDAEYLASSGVDPSAVADAGERAERGRGGGGASRREAVEEALRDLGDPTAEDVADYAADRGVDRDAAREVLERLRRAGEVTERGDTYRLL